MCSTKQFCETIEKVNYLQNFFKEIVTKERLVGYINIMFRKIKQGTKLPKAGPYNQCKLLTLVKRGILKKKFSHLSEKRCFNLLKFLFFIDVELLVYVSNSLISIVIHVLSIRLGKVMFNPKQNPLSPPVTTSHILYIILPMLDAYYHLKSLDPIGFAQICLFILCSFSCELCCPKAPHVLSAFTVSWYSF